MMAQNIWLLQCTTLGTLALLITQYTNNFLANKVPLIDRIIFKRLIFLQKETILKPCNVINIEAYPQFNVRTTVNTLAATRTKTVTCGSE